MLICHICINTGDGCIHYNSTVARQLPGIHFEFYDSCRSEDAKMQYIMMCCIRHQEEDVDFGKNPIPGPLPQHRIHSLDYNILLY